LSVPPTVWEAVLLLQLLRAADAKRLQIASSATAAIRAAELAAERPLTPNRIGRTLSRTESQMKRKIGSQEVEVTGVNRTQSQAPATSVALPASCFHIEALLDAHFPPELELALFMQQAKLEVLSHEQLCTDARFEVGPNSSLPGTVCSFMANGDVVPVPFKKQVLHAENQFRQQQEQLSGMFRGEGAFRILPSGGIQVPASALFFILEVSRDNLVADTMSALKMADVENLRKPLKVKFSNEDGVDEGGVAREFFRLLAAQLFQPEFGLFKIDSDSQFLWFDMASANDEQDFWTAGALIGLAVYNNIPALECNFPPAVFKKLKGLPVTLADLHRLFPSQGVSVQAVLDWLPPLGMSPDETDQCFQETFCLDFAVGYETPDGVHKTTNLLGEECGEPPPVNFKRREEFVELYKDWHLSRSVEKQFKAFESGFSRVCGSPVFNCLSWSELEAIVCGERDLDFEHLRKGAQVVESEVAFTDGYLDAFWEMALAFDAEQKKQFLNFATGSDLAPVGGLERVQLKVQRNGGEPTSRLPTSHTCFNLLLLPEYGDQDKMRRLLLLAIENADGFGLE